MPTMDRRRFEVGRLAPVGAATVIALRLGPGVASAHEVAGSRFDAPLPLGLLLVGAGATVGLTAIWLAAASWSPSGSSRAVATIDARTARWLRAGLRAVFLLGVVAALVAGYVGRQVATENFATVFTWPVWFRGVALLAVLVGSPWPVLSPWRTVYRGLVRLEGGRLALLGEYPSRLGSWPAALGFLLLLGVVENLTVIARSPALTAVVIAAYALVTLGGAVLFGPVWFERADPLEVLYRLFGRVSGITLERGAGGEVTFGLRPPWEGCRAPVAGLSLVVFVVATVYTVSFDGFTETRLYQALLFWVRDALGLGPSTDVLLYLAGLVGFVAAFLSASLLSEQLGGATVDPTVTAADGGATTQPDTGPEGETGWYRAARAFAPTILPIAAAYDVAHNYPYVVGNSARLVEVALEPLASVGVADPLAWLSLPAFWGSQVLLIVLGHVIAVVAAHAVAVARYGERAARGGHLPLVVIMIGYTALSLWIISQPVVG